MSTEPRTRPPTRDRDHRATVLAALLLAASAAALAYILLGAHHDPVEPAADPPRTGARA
ncbi:hypothetical protein AB0C96_28825 [Streptomyces sp. NPDC048506]|uniref:hypothetical protein n=1 Tax=Streptomyces sp. NPDC048506 TaxID=3155028 RepID=UPI00341E0817